MGERTDAEGDYPRLDELGGVRALQKSMERSRAVVANREAIAFELLSMATTRMTDLVEWDDQGNVRVKSVAEMPVHATAAIKKVVMTRGKEGESRMEVEMFDKVQVLRVLAKASGLLDKAESDDKPSVIDVQLVRPK